MSIHVPGIEVSERVITQVHTASKESCHSDPACLTPWLGVFLMSSGTCVMEMAALRPKLGP